MTSKHAALGAVREYLKAKGAFEAMEALNWELPPSSSEPEDAKRALGLEKVAAKSSGDPTALELLCKLQLHKSSKRAMGEAGSAKEQPHAQPAAPFAGKGEEGKGKPLAAPSKAERHQGHRISAGPSRELDEEEGEDDDDDGDEGVRAPKVETMVLEDVGEEIEEAPAVAKAMRTPQLEGFELGLKEEGELLKAAFGPGKEPPSGWQQGFFFTEEPEELRYGLVQARGGPCGVLASVQARMLAFLDPTRREMAALSDEERREGLVQALSGALWECREGKRWPAAVCFSTKGTTGSMSFKEVAPTLRVYEAWRKGDLDSAVRDVLDQWGEPGGHGVNLFVASLVMARGGPGKVVADMDEAGSAALAAEHGFCSQELVNLCLLGRAHSNVFDGERHLGEGFRLRGWPIGAKSPRAGFLTCSEFLGHVEVGSACKRPSAPVWVVCSDSHFTVLFSPSPAALHDQRPFPLLFYDGLQGMREPIRLTVHHSSRSSPSPSSSLTPPLELVIETCWPSSHVDWNGSEPVL